jgi:hypothetical protein
VDSSTTYLYSKPLSSFLDRVSDGRKKLKSSPHFYFLNSFKILPRLKMSEIIQSASMIAKRKPIVAPDTFSTIQPSLKTYFEKCVKGYHLINDEPIKEAPWEDINAQVLIASGCTVESKSSGSHKSGADISCSLGDFSNKSTQYEPNNKSFKISSYRLTSVCSDKDPGTIESIINEINSRKNFKYYSIIVRRDSDKEITYDWYNIPADYPALDPSTYTWSQKLGKIGRNKGSVTGWETDVIDGSSMSITFSMSSQLWINVAITEELKKNIIASVTINKGRNLNYIQLCDMLTKSQ